jgi:hypothetical protein
VNLGIWRNKKPSYLETGIRGCRCDCWCVILTRQPCIRKFLTSSAQPSTNFFPELLAVPYSALIGPDAITAYVPLFFGGGLKARLTWSILIAFSASGSLLSVIYACARGILSTPSIYPPHLSNFI